MRTNAKAFFNDNGSVTIETKPNVRFVFTTVSSAVNFCKDHNIEADMQ